MKLNEEEQKIFEQRQKRYGHFIDAHENLGLVWTGLIQNYFRIKLSEPIPSHLVLLMMAASKLNRAVAEKDLPDSDNYNDNKIYIEMAKQAKENYEEQKDESLEE